MTNKFTCYRCDTQFEATPTVVDLSGEEHKYIICPVCKTKTILK